MSRRIFQIEISVEDSRERRDPTQLLDAILRRIENATIPDAVLQVRRARQKHRERPPEALKRPVQREGTITDTRDRVREGRERSAGKPGERNRGA